MKLKLKNKMKNKKKVGCITTSSHVIGISGGGGGGGGGGSSSSSSFGGALIEGDWLVCEILTRLPVKSLSRFKSVCKGWCSLIQQDQNFIGLHLTRSQTRPFPPCRLVIVVTVPKTKEEKKIKSKSTDKHTWPYKNLHITADLLFKEDNKGHNRAKVEVDTVREISYSPQTKISKPMNGLICLLDSFKNYGVRLCNISTGEISPWIESTMFEEIKYANDIPLTHYVKIPLDYGFGFNPATNEHKLVWLWELVKFSDNTASGLRELSSNIICEVLTIGRHHEGGGGNNRWRRIEEVPPAELTRGKSVYVNGVIYWGTRDLEGWGLGFYNRPAHIVAFDVGSEKFRTITISNSIPYQVPNRVDRWNGYVDLLQVDGHLAILFRKKNGVFHMCIYKGDYKEEEEINRTSTTSSCKNSGSWSEVSIGKLPFHERYNDWFTFDTLVGSNDMIILTLRHKYCAREVKNKKKRCFSIYCCNWKKGIWTELDVSGLPFSVQRMYTSNFFASSLETIFSPSQIPQIISTHS